MNFFRALNESDVVILLINEWCSAHKYDNANNGCHLKIMSKINVMLRALSGEKQTYWKLESQKKEEMKV